MSSCSVKQCCCGCSLRTGSLAIGVVFGIYDIILLILAIISTVHLSSDCTKLGVLGFNFMQLWYDGHGVPAYVTLGHGIASVIYALHMLMCVMLVWGIVKNKTGLCMTWVIGSIVCVVLEIMYGLYIVIYLSIFLARLSGPGGLSGFLIAVVVSVSVLVAVHIYFIVVIRSFCRSIEDVIQLA